MKKVLLVTDGFFHPPLLARKALREILAELEGFEFEHIRSIEKLPKNLVDFSALVIYLHHQNISENALSALDNFVSNGGGVLGVHTATAAYKEHLHYFEILGGRFVGHGPIAPFDVTPVDESHVFTGIPSFSVKDELYLHELKPEITPHFVSMHEGQEIPVVWTHQYGEGRVCYSVPGHRTETMRDKTYQKILQRGLIWVCGV